MYINGLLTTAQRHTASTVKSSSQLRRARVHMVRDKATPVTQYLAYFPQPDSHHRTKSTRLSFLGSCPTLFLNRSEQEVGK